MSGSNANATFRPFQMMQHMCIMRYAFKEVHLNYNDKCYKLWQMQKSEPLNWAWSTLQQSFQRNLNLFYSIMCSFSSLQIISYDSPRGGVSVITEKGETTTSFLLIQNARPSDSGQYQCNPSNAKSRSVTVHVLNGKYFSTTLVIPNVSI